MNMQLEPEYNYCGTKSKIKLNWFEWYFIHFKKRKMKKEETKNRKQKYNRTSLFFVLSV